MFQIDFQYSGDLFCESEFESHARAQLYYFFFGHSRAVLLAWFLLCFHVLSFNGQGLSNLLGFLAVRLNELETSLVYNNKIKLTPNQMVRELFGFSSCSEVNKIATKRLVKNLYRHFTGILLEKITRKKGFWELPSTCKLHIQILRIKFSGREVKIFGHLQEHRTVFGSFSEKIASKRQLLRLKK